MPNAERLRQEQRVSRLHSPPICHGKCSDSVGAINCTSDSDCADAGVGFICDSLCDCFQGGVVAEPTCSQGCTKASDCAPGQSCDAMHRCQAASCKQASDCGANLVCNGGACAAKPCTSDTECNAEYCVESATGWEGETGARTCQPTLGTCTPYSA